MFENAATFSWNYTQESLGSPADSNCPMAES